MAEVGNRTDIEINVPLLRHMILNSLRGYKQKFGKQYGEMVIACDNMKYWRRDVFPLYKAGRKKLEKSPALIGKLSSKLSIVLEMILIPSFPIKY